MYTSMGYGFTGQGDQDPHCAEGFHRETPLTPETTAGVTAACHSVARKPGHK